MKGFWRELGKKMTFGFVSSGIDVGAKLAMWQYFYGSTHSY